MTVKNPKVRKGIGVFALVFGALYIVVSILALNPDFRLLPILGMISGSLYVVFGYAILTGKVGKPPE